MLSSTKMNIAPRLRKKPAYNERKRLLSSKQNAITTNTGYFNGFCVVIDKLEDIHNVHFNGFYGKANFSRSFPSSEINSLQISTKINNEKLEPKYCSGSLIYPTDVNTEPLDLNITSSGLTTIPTDLNTASSDLTTIPTDLNTASSDLTTVPTDLNTILPDLNTEPIQHFSVQETLNLMLEEAFYLMSYLNRLDIYYNEELLTADAAWKLFMETQDNFVQNYVVYYYFRTRNWVLKCGLKYGGDFLVYKEGPPFYHSSYLIIVDVLSKETLERNKIICKRSLNWENLFGLYRMAEAAAKDVLICQVLWPDNLTIEEMKSSKDLLKSCAVKPILMRRWCPNQERTVVH